MEGTPRPQPHFRAKFEDLTAEEKHIGDHIFPLLDQCNRYTMHPSDANRKGFWGFVFHNWDTTKPIIKPKFPRRAARASYIPVGTLIGDCPFPAVGTDTHVPAERRAHAEVFLKISVSPTATDFSFRYMDARHRIVPEKMVQLREGLTMPKSRNMVADHYDEHEKKRVRTFNENLVIYWVRQHLVAKMEDDAAGSLELSLEKQDRDFDYGQLFQLRLARDALDVFRDIRTDTHQFFRWEDAMNRM